MKWPSINEIRVFTPLPEGYAWDLLSPAEIATAIEFFNTWLPSITVGSAKSFLDPGFYVKDVLGSDRSNTPFLVVVVRHAGEIVAIAAWEKVDGPDIIFGRLGAVSAAHRHSNLAVAAQELGTQMGQQMGAGLIYGMATTHAPYMQRALERAGYIASGILPGFDREELQPSVIRRVFEVMYVKRLAPHEDFLTPSRVNLTPAVARLYDEIFSQDPSFLPPP